MKQFQYGYVRWRDATPFEKACYVIIILGILNFVAFVAAAIYLGGDALNGKMEAGHYYVYGVRVVAGQKVYTEVSAPVFFYSRCHSYSVLLTWPLVMVAGFCLNRRSRQQSLSA